jgi:hypothetical protein
MAAEAAGARAPRALFVAHGMGQQVKYQTIDELALGICAAAGRRGHDVLTRTARTVRHDGTTLRRLELEIDDGAGTRLPPVHIYEGYWAPLTEGAVVLRDVLRFLFGGGINGVRSQRLLHRWMFGAPRTFPIPLRNVAALWAALIAILSIVVVGGAVLVAGTGQLLVPGWIPPELVQDLTAVFEALFAVLLVCSMTAAVLTWLIGRKIAPPATLLAPALAAGAAFVVAAVFVVFYVLGNLPPPFPAVCGEPCRDFFRQVVDPWLGGARGVFCWLGRGLEYLLPAVAWLAFVVVLWQYFAARSETASADDEKARKRGRGGRPTLIVSFWVLAVFLTVYGCGDAIPFITWLSLLGASLFIRAFLIQYVGDVAAYVSPHVVDRFNELRHLLKNTVSGAARAVYALRDEGGSFVHQHVVIAGHSLGSVIVYDTLNQLISEDELAPASALEVEKRTKLLLTYGSPLDKTAFIFSLHDAKAGSERDALTAAGQPLIARDRPFPWKNIWSPFDIISGPLELYDLPDRTNANPVDNQADPDANLLLAAHTQYNRNPLLFDTLYAALS